ncbi:ATP-binding protein [Streptomyces sp. NPDC001633]|uniref:ATP-binding protein n=1 Tax=Streptomyces sp. NPDC001633 TaxID=3364595 RepID=UPI003679115E
MEEAMPLMAETGAQQYRQELTVDPQSLRHVRGTVLAYVRGCGWGELDDAASLCVTELLSNVWKHTDSDECVLLIQPSVCALRIVVSDSSPQLPVVQAVDACSDSGRGLLLVNHTADAWGVNSAGAGTGKDVWVEFRPQSKRAAA